jgi:hypothetical protein
MRDAANYSDADRYAITLKPFSDYTRLLNYLQLEFRVSMHSGPEVDGLDYSSSSALTNYASADTLLSASVSAALVGFPADADACLLSVTSPQDLLSALIAARLLRRRTPSIYLSIISHSYENFSLDCGAAALTASSPIFGLVDSVVRFASQKDDAVLLIMRSLVGGVRPTGFIENPPAGAAFQGVVTSQSLDEVFAPAPVFWTRLSPGRCYWSRCAFCIQSAKHRGATFPSETDIDIAVERVAGLALRGCHNFYFGDEAVSPTLLERLCAAIETRKLEINWACRCRIDAGYSRELFSRLKATGCYEVLFGVESVVPRVQRLMNKYERPMDEVEIRKITDHARAAGLNVHLTFLTCFPGETLAEAAATVRFAASALKDAPLSTYYFNVFTLYPRSEVYNNPAKYGLAVSASAGDLPSPREYAFLDESARMEDAKIRGALPGLIAETEKTLGWAGFDSRPEYRLCRDLYFNYGHGALIKAAGTDIFRGVRAAFR